MLYGLRLLIVLLLGGSKPCRSGKTAVLILLDLISCQLLGVLEANASVTLRNWCIFWRLYTRSADREFLIVIGSFATSEWRA